MTSSQEASRVMTAILEPWISKADLAAHLRLSVRSVDRMVADGLPHAVVLGRVRVHASEVEAWLEDRGLMGRIGSHPPTEEETGA